MDGTIGWPVSQQVSESCGPRWGVASCVIDMAELWGDEAGRDSLIQNIVPGSPKGLLCGLVAKSFHHIPIR